MFWKVVSLLALLLAFVAIIIAVVSEDRTKQAGLNGLTPAPEDTYPASCKLVRGKTNGLYKIQPNAQVLPFYTYCDMNSGGGGWTLVASVHENNINGKCTIGDKWSSEQETSEGYLSSRNWENKNTFGRADAVTTADFKNAAYYASEASNVMLWHVPNDVKVAEMSKRAYFKYYTTNNFLKKYGSTLYSLYDSHVPLRKAEGGIKDLLKTLNQTNLVAGIDNWYNYRYDVLRNPSRISDGGGDMYDGGNRVFFRSDTTNFTTMVYGDTYFLFGQGVEVSSAQMHPFIALSWIGNMTKTNQYFDFQVKSNYGADGGGNYTTYQKKKIVFGTTTQAMYRAFNVYNTTDPSVCEVFFYIGDSTKWNSVVPFKVEVISWSNSTHGANNVMRFYGPMKNVFIGYTLLSRKRGVVVTKKQVEEVLKKIMNTTVSYEFDYSHQEVVTPVHFIKGNPLQLKSGIPILQQNLTEAGYIQFRAFNTAGYPNALCPGIKTTSNYPEQFCIGGINTGSALLNQCGDFAGWGGAVREAKRQNLPTATGKSLRDIDSTILIFTK